MAGKFYVDDLVAAVDSDEEAMDMKRQLCLALQQCKMNICKWRSSSAAVDRKWIEDETRPNTTVLGLMSNVDNDLLSCSKTWHCGTIHSVSLHQSQWRQNCFAQPSPAKARLG